MSDVPGRLNAAPADRYASGRELGRGGMATGYEYPACEHSRNGYVHSRYGNTSG